MALTITNKRNNIIGNMRQTTATLVSTSGTDVWVTGLKLIRGISLDEIAGTPGNVGASLIAGGSVTLAVPANATISAIVTGF